MKTEVCILKASCFLCANRVSGHSTAAQQTKALKLCKECCPKAAIRSPTSARPAQAYFQ